MGKKRSQYTKEYKTEVVHLTIEESDSPLRWLVNLPRVYCIVGKRSLRKARSTHF
jgi:hypothetical protein